MYKSTGRLPFFAHQYYSSKNSSENPHLSPGLFDECLSHRTDSPNFHGQYCTIFVDVELITDSKDEKTNYPKEFINGNPKSQTVNTKNIDQDFYFVLISLPSIGFCLPSSCSAADLQTAIARQMSSRIRANDENNKTLVVVADENLCYTRENINGTKFDWSDHIMMYSNIKN